jgi:ribonuclease P protein component
LIKKTLPKSERLCSVKAISALFDRKSESNFSDFSFPIKIVYNQNAENEGFSQVVFSVSKKGFKKAVDRNTIKRRMKEAYRLHKTYLSEIPKHIIFIYISKKIEDYTQIEKGMIAALKKMK